jgi:protein CpxP
MKPTFQRLAVLGALGMSLCVAASAVAQDRPGGPPPGARAGEHQKMFEDMKHRREQRLHDLLQIKPDQETAFRAYISGLEALRPQRQQGPRGPGAEPEARKPLTTPERLDREAQRMAERQQRQQKAAAVTKTFYAALSPDQRKAFDTLAHGFGGEHGGRGGHMGMRGRGWGPGGAPPS